MTNNATMRHYIQLLKLRIGAMIALTAVMGYVAIAEHVSILHLAALVLAMLAGSGASSIVNHVYDRDIDRLMTRTCNRPLASGLIAHPARVLFLAGLLMALAVAISLSVFNVAVAVHLFLGAFLYGVVYTIWLKRRTWLNIVIGGGAGSFAVLAGAAAVDPARWLLPSLLAITLFLWTPSHFWALAILLKEDYRKARVPMLPVLVGEKKTAWAIFFNSCLLVASSLVPVFLGELGKTYLFIAASLGAGLLWLNWRLIGECTPLLARRNFLASMIYLAGLFVAVLIDVHI